MAEATPRKPIGKILIVDDNTANLQLLTKILSEQGHAVYPASDGMLALRFVQGTLPDIILLDIKMPVMDGYEVSRRLKAEEKTRSIPIIFISVLEDEHDKIKGFQAGGVDYINKPFHAEEVLARVNTHLLLRQAQMDLERRNDELMSVYDTLKDKVRERTIELEQANASLKDEIAEKLEAVEALRRSEANYRSVIENIQDVFYRSDAGGNLIMASPSALRLLGYDSFDGLLGKPIAETFYLQPEKREELLAKIRETGSVTNYEIMLKKRDGTPVVVETNSHCYYEGGAVAGIEGVLRDITERKRAEERQNRLEGQLIEARKMESIGRLAGGIAHDFNNMLTPILGYAEMLRLNRPKDDLLITGVEQIIEAGQRSRNLVRQLLAFACRQTLEMKPVDLNKVIGRFEQMLRHTLRENITIELRLAPVVGTIRADIGQIEQIILNLAVNSQDAMPRGGNLSFETNDVVLDKECAGSHEVIPPGSYILMHVRDTGVGINKEIMDKIFEPFFTTKSDGKGIGLGLSTVYGIVRQHGGGISVFSNPGQGTHVQIYFPRFGDPADPVATAAKQEKPLPRGDETLLVVEDQEQVRAFAVYVLRQHGYTVLQADNLESAMAVAASHPGNIPLLITDVILPDGNGKDLHDKLTHARPKIRALYMSGYPSDAITHHGVLQQGVHFIQKPFSIQGFTEKVRYVLQA